MSKFEWPVEFSVANRAVWDVWETSIAHNQQQIVHIQTLMRHKKRRAKMRSWGQWFGK